MRLVGVFGGTFDPIHHGHLRMAQEVLQSTPMTELRFVPSRVPPHREAPGTSAEDRVRLLEAALAHSDPRLQIDTRELTRPGPSYMVDTLRSLRQELGNEPSLALILGVDAMHGLPEWSRWTQLTDLAHLIILGRPGYSPIWPDALGNHLKGRLHDHPEHLVNASQGYVIHLPVTQLEISASQIRSLLKHGKSANYLTPAAVLKAIEELGLYRPD